MIRVVCFDIGGVLVHVARTWAEAMQRAGFESTPALEIKLEEWDGLKLYQSGSLSESKYQERLVEFLGLSPADAVKVHNGILMEATDGTMEIVENLNVRGIITACLSNTNGMHWVMLTDPEIYPNIELLNFKIASHLLKCHKPDRAIYRTFERAVDCKPNEIIFFEDSTTNYQGAIDAGWNAVLIDPQGNQETQIRFALAGFELLV